MVEKIALTDADKKYWGPLPPVIDWVMSKVSDGDRVLEIGPGNVSFPAADTFVGWIDWDAVSLDNLVQCDIQKDPLPFSDNEFDFVYCRHVLEDIYNPFLVCQEMSRVAKAGYLETPSPMAEMCRGIDGGSPPWRGYIHHRYIVWNDNGTLRFLTKYPVVDHTNSDELDKQIVNMLRDNTLCWNTYFAWKDEIPFTYYQHEVDYHLITGALDKDYGAMIIEAIHQGTNSTRDFANILSKST